MSLLRSFENSKAIWKPSTKILPRVLFKKSFNSQACKKNSPKISNQVFQEEAKGDPAITEVTSKKKNFKRTVLNLHQVLKV